MFQTDKYSSPDDVYYASSRAIKSSGSPTQKKNHLRATLSTQMASNARSKAINSREAVSLGVRSDGSVYEEVSNSGSRSPSRPRSGSLPPRYRGLSAEFDVFRAKRRRRMRSPRSRSPRRESPRREASSDIDRYHRQRSSPHSASPTHSRPFLLSTKVPDIFREPALYARSSSGSDQFHSHSRLVSEIGTMAPSSLQEGISLSELLNGKNDLYYGGDINLVKIGKGDLYSASEFTRQQFDTDPVVHRDIRPVTSAKPDWTTDRSPMSANDLRNPNSARKYDYMHDSRRSSPYDSSPYAGNLSNYSTFSSHDRPTDRNLSYRANDKTIISPPSVTPNIQTNSNTLFSTDKVSTDQKKIQKTDLKKGSTNILQTPPKERSSEMSSKIDIDTPYRHWSQSDTFGTPVVTDLGSNLESVPIPISASIKTQKINPSTSVSHDTSKLSLKTDSKDSDPKGWKAVSASVHGNAGKLTKSGSSSQSNSPTDVGKKSDGSLSPKKPADNVKGWKAVAASVHGNNPGKLKSASPPSAPSVPSAPTLSAPSSPSVTHTTAHTAAHSNVPSNHTSISTSPLPSPPKSKAAVPTRASLGLVEKKEEPKEIKEEITEKEIIPDVDEIRRFSPPVLVPPRHALLPYKGDDDYLILSSFSAFFFFSLFFFHFFVLLFIC